MHRRRKSHLEKKNNIMTKHTEQYHSEGPAPSYSMKILRGSRTLMDRLVWESQLIYTAEDREPGILMNSRGEWGGNKMVRFVAKTERI